jgi:hypothetical protein
MKQDKFGAIISDGATIKSWDLVRIWHVANMNAIKKGTECAAVTFN